MWVTGGLSILLLIQAIPAIQGNYPFGGRVGNDEGAAAIAQILIDEPYGTVLYDHDYSWHWRYHFFYKGVYVEWFENEKDLFENLEAFFTSDQHNKRYLVLKTDEKLSDSLKSSLPNSGYRLKPIAAEGKIELYLITQDQP